MNSRHFRRSNAVAGLSGQPCREFLSAGRRAPRGLEETGPDGSTMKGPSVALLVFMISLVGCAVPGELLFKNSIVVDHLDGNYQILARCTYEHLARQGRRGWKPRQALCQASTRSHWLARARHRGKTFCPCKPLAQRKVGVLIAFALRFGVVNRAIRVG